MAKIIHKLDDELREGLMDLRKNGLKRGESPGFEELYEHYSLKPGSTTYIVAGPHVGKSVFINEIAMNLAVQNNWTWLMFSPETGSPKDMYAELLWVYLRKPFLKNDYVNANEAEIEIAIEFIKKHFIVLDPGHGELDEHKFFKAIDDLKSKDGITINGCIIDSISDFYIDSSIRQDIALSNFLIRIRKFSSSYNVHTILSFHTSATQYVVGKNVYGEDVRYQPAPTMFNIAGGQSAGRKGMMILSLYRPPLDVIDKRTNEPYKKHQMQVLIQKAKPKTVGKVGEVSLFYDPMSSRFYQLGETGKKLFSNDFVPDKKVEI